MPIPKRPVPKPQPKLKKFAETNEAALADAGLNESPEVLLAPEPEVVEGVLHADQQEGPDALMLVACVALGIGAGYLLSKYLNPSLGMPDVPPVLPRK